MDNGWKSEINEVAFKNGVFQRSKLNEVNEVNKWREQNVFNYLFFYVNFSSEKYYSNVLLCHENMAPCSEWR